MASVMSRTSVSVLALVLSCSVGCEKKETPAASTTATAAATPMPTPTPAPEPEPTAEQKPKRPDKVETEVTPERRTKVEAAITEAKGFLVMSDLEEQLKAAKLKAKDPAVARFDRSAAGKWVLFTGPLVNQTDTGFDLAVTYTAQMPGDPMGMSRQWFPVTFTDVKGYDKTKLKLGQVVVVLAKYNGKQQASSANELVELGHW